MTIFRHFQATFVICPTIVKTCDIDQIVGIHSASVALYGSHWGIYNACFDWSRNNGKKINCLDRTCIYQRRVLAQKNCSNKGYLRCFQLKNLILCLKTICFKIEDFFLVTLCISSFFPKQISPKRSIKNTFYIVRCLIRFDWLQQNSSLNQNANPNVLFFTKSILFFHFWKKIIWFRPKFQF